MFLKRLSRRLLSPYYFSKYAGIPNVYDFYRQYVGHDRLSRKQLLEFQMRKLKEILLHARDHTEYYRQLFSDYSFDPQKIEAIEQLNCLPVLTKNIIRENLLRLLADNISENNRHVSFTGGTSGVKMDFFRDNPCRSHRMAFQWRSDAWAGWSPYSNIAYVWGAMQDFYPRTKLKDRFINDYITGVQLNFAWSLDEKKYARLVKNLIKFKPVVIRCIPSPTTLLAEYIIAKGISIPSIKGLVTTAEPLYPHQRRILESAFNAPVFNLYASREVGTTAAECIAHRDLHIAVDSVVLEITDKGRQLSLGEYGDIVLTDLHNYGMPLIRYSVGDCGQLSDDDCTCGMEYPMLKNVIGRTIDFFYDAEGKSIISGSMVVDIVDEGPPVGQVQFIQNSVEEILVRMTKDPMPDDSVKKFYETQIKKAFKDVTTVKFDIVDRIEKEASGKYRFTICNIDPAEIARLKERGRGKK